MVEEQQVAQVIDEIRPMLQMHGGDIKLVGVTEDGEVWVVLQGACHGCPMAQLTIQRGVEARLRQAIPDVKRVVPVEEEVSDAQ